MNDVYMARPPKILIVLSVLPNWNKIVNQSINQYTGVPIIRHGFGYLAFLATNYHKIIVSQQVTIIM